MQARPAPVGDPQAEQVRLFPLRAPFAHDGALHGLLRETLAAAAALQQVPSGVLRLADPDTGELYTAATLDAAKDDAADDFLDPGGAGTPLHDCDGRLVGALSTEVPAHFARLAGAAIGSAALQGQRLRESDRERECVLEREREAKRRSEFLAEASRLLGSSLQYEPTLATVAGLALPFLGSWCFVDLVEPDGTMRRVAVVHPDPEKQKLARRLENGWPPERDDPLGAPRAVRTRTSEALPHVSDEMLVAAAHGDENLRILRALGIGSLIVAPIIARDAVLGAITFVSADTGHQYTQDDLVLAEEVASRSAVAIENARLLRAAEEANQAKSIFLSTMSHELRTPLNAIGGYADLLEMEIKGPVTAEQREQIGRIRTNQRHLLSLVNTVLDFAKLDAGRMEYDIQAVEVSAAIRDMESVVAPLAEEKGIAFPRDCEGSGLQVLADREKLAQILVNLFTNAVKFTQRGGGISLRCGRAGDRVRFQVQDTGIGISAEHFAHIFEPFMQVSEGNTRKKEGTGLGLAISRNLARGMGGEITVESTPGKGSTFTVELPCADAPAVEDGLVIAFAGAEEGWSGEERRSGKERRAAAAAAAEAAPA